MYTFAADSDKLTTLAGDLKDISSSVDGDIGATYANIGGFESTVWSGSSYNDFQDGCNAYKSALETIPSIINQFANAFEKAAGGVDEMLKPGVDAAIKEIS